MANLTENEKEKEAKEIMAGIKVDFSNIAEMMQSKSFANTIKKQNLAFSIPKEKDSNEDDKQLAVEYSNEIDGYVKALNVDPNKRTALKSRLDWLDIVAILTPLITTFVSAYAYILTEQVITFLIGAIGAIPPAVVKITKKEVDSFNSCSDLCFQFLTLKGKINRLAIIDKLRDNMEEINKELNELTEKARKLGIIVTLSTQ